jgi:hypothetical protein
MTPARTLMPPTLARIVADHRKKLEAWAQGCGEVRLDPGRLATDASAIT